MNYIKIKEIKKPVPYIKYTAQRNTSPSYNMGKTVLGLVYPDLSVKFVFVEKQNLSYIANDHDAVYKALRDPANRRDFKITIEFGNKNELPYY